MTAPTVAHASIVLPMFRLLPVTDVEGYLISARSLLPSLKLLCEAGNEHLRGGAMVAGFILECSLKAFIVNSKLKKNAAQNAKDKVKTLNEHDLEKYWRDAKAGGLQVESTPPQWCSILNSLHFKNMTPGANGRSYAVRYQSGNHGLSFPVTADLLSGVEEVLAKVEQAIKQN